MPVMQKISDLLQTGVFRIKGGRDFEKKKKISGTFDVADGFFVHSYSKGGVACETCDSGSERCCP